MISLIIAHILLMSLRLQDCLGLLKVELPLAQDRLFLNHKYTPLC